MQLIPAQKLAEILKVNVTTIERRAARGIYKYEYTEGRGRGGYQMLIALESLPENERDRYHGIEKERREEELAQFTNDQLHAANEKKGCVLEYWRSGLSPAEFVAQRNAMGYYAPITEGQLYAWQRILKDGGDLPELVDKRGGFARKGTSTILPDAWEYFYALYMTQQKRTVQWCHKQTKKAYPDIPSVKTFQRRVQEIPHLAITRHREGETAYRDSLPSMQRSRLDINSNDVWFSDHHLFDVFVRNKKGKAVRLWLTVFFDARSNKVVGALIRDADPNATAIKQCFRMSVEQNGLPNEVYFDNGKDYRSKDFNRDYPHSLVNRLGINVIYATPYHGQAKTVERFFGTVEKQFGPMWDTYCGKDAKQRPELMRMSNKEIAKIAPTVDEFITAFYVWLDEYHNAPSRGQDMGGKTPNQVYSENLKQIREVSDHEALRLICGNSVERTVQKNGICMFNNFYYNDTLLRYIGQKVVAVYDPANIDEVAIFDQKNDAICMATAKLVSGFRHTSEEAYIEAAKQKRAAHKLTEDHAPIRGMSVQEIIARNQLLERYEERKDVPKTEHLTAQASRNATILKDSRPKAREEDNLTDALTAYYLQKEDVYAAH